MIGRKRNSGPWLRSPSMKYLTDLSLESKKPRRITIFGSGRLENLSSTRAIDQNDLPRNDFGPTNNNRAAKSVLRGAPCSSNRGRPPQSPMGSHQGREKAQANPPTTHKPNMPIAKPVVRT